MDMIMFAQSENLKENRHAAGCFWMLTPVWNLRLLQGARDDVSHAEMLGSPLSTSHVTSTTDASFSNFASL